MLAIVDQGVISQEQGRGAYMPIITPLSDGTSIACQHVGSKLGAPDNHIEVLRSTDHGKSWVNQGRIHGDGHPNDGWAYRGPDIGVVSDGRLIMIATRFETAADHMFDIETEALQRPELLVYWSQDQGRTWSPPQVLSVDLDPNRYTVNSAGRFLQAAPDRWLYPVETWKPTGHDGPPDQKAAMLVSIDQGETWGDFTVVADDTTGRILYWDQMGCILPDGRIYTMFWTHKHGTKEDLTNHWSVSQDHGRTWSPPQPTNLRGQVCSPIALSDGRVAAIYNFRHEPQGIHVAITDDFSHFDLDHEAVVFDAGAEAALGKPKTEQFMEEHMMIGFGKPAGHLEANGTLMTYFWCTVAGLTHTRWVRLRV